MMMYEYLCEEHGKFEAFSDIATRKEPRECPICGELATYAISMPRSKLEGISGDFPTAYDKWTRAHEVGAKQPSHWLGE
jgi:putative FmdB family regulatory protein